MSAPVSDRPNPIMAAVASVGTAVSAILGVVAFLVQYGVLTPEQGEAFDTAGRVVVESASPLGAITSGLFVAVTGVAASFAAGKVAKGSTTPTADPRDDAGRRLTPEGQ